jgi:chemotaxis protein methyltransferase CheR
LDRLASPGRTAGQNLPMGVPAVETEFPVFIWVPAGRYSGRSRMRESDYQFIRNLVYERSRINLGPDKRELVAARLAKRLRAMQLASIGDYCSYLRTTDAQDEVANLIDAISTNHTFFFREGHHFEYLRASILPELAGRRRAERWPGLRVWSAACSSGEESYSLAITFAELLPALAADWSWRIDSTDISHRILDRARAAIYSEESVVGHVPPLLVTKYFQRGFGPQAGNYRVKPSLQEHVNFSHLNLVEGQFHFADLFHVILCRNVMIYFDRPTQEELVAKLAGQLVPGGYLLVGHSESLTGIRHSLALVAPAIYRRPPSAKI